ncbi:hypothetical protein N9J60_00650 [Alphaproteobacteria bacterium]|nr:hypothetical protein [Alphaproteobacteria bacterium]
MRSGIFVTTLVSLILISVFSFGLLSHDEDLKSRTPDSIALYRSANKELISLLQNKNKFECAPDQHFQSCLDKNISKVIYVKSGSYQIAPFRLNSGQKLVIGADTTLKLGDDIEMPYKDGYVVGIMGTKNEPIKGVTVILDGVIDGNKSQHPYERSGNECLRVDYAFNLKIFGAGILQNCSGDGLDIDISRNVFISGLSAINNSGAGFHVGSGRPMGSSSNILGVGLIATNNGHKLGRAGLDASWPNENSNIYLLSSGEKNYRNWELEGAGALSILSTSIEPTEADVLTGSSLSVINGVERSSILENVSYIKQLILRDLKIAYGTLADLFINPDSLERDFKGNIRGRVPDYLKPLTYWRL